MYIKDILLLFPMSFGFGDGHSIKWSITWDQYACFKKKRGCCGQDCSGCCFIPKNKQGSIKIDKTVANQVRFMLPQFSPSLRFTEQIDPSRQKEICTILQQKNGTKELWNAYFGTNVH